MGAGDAPKVPLVHAALGPCADAMASEAECADVIVGDGELLHGERAADGERDAANAVDRVECAYDAGVVSGPDGVGHGVECEGGDGLAIECDRYRWSIHEGKVITWGSLLTSPFRRLHHCTSIAFVPLRPVECPTSS